MDPITIAILLVGFGVWVLSNVLKNAGAKNPGGGPIAARPRAAVNEIDRFLEEINRRRQQQQQPQAAQPARPPPPARPAPVPARPLPQAKPLRVEQPKVKPLPRPETKAKSKPAAVRPQAIVVGTPVEPPPSARVYDVVPADVPLADFPPALALKPTAAAGTGAPRLGGSMAKQIRQLLRHRATVRSVLVASEILGPPMCRRRGRR